MYLYETQTVVYTLDKSGEGVYRILSATAVKPEEDTLEEEIPAEDNNE